MKKRLFPLAALGIALLLLAGGCKAARNDLVGQYAGTFSLLGTEPAEPGALGALSKAEAEYNEETNQTARKLALANGGTLWLNDAMEIVEAENFEGGGGADSPEAAAAVLEGEFALEGYLPFTRESSGLIFLRWEKQEGEYRNPHNSLHAVLDGETFALKLLRRYAFPAETITPGISEEEALEAAAPWLGANQYDRLELVCRRANLNAGTPAPPQYAPAARLAYVFYRGNRAAAIDAVTGELMNYTEAIAAEEADSPNI